MRFTTDHENDVAYLYIADEIEDGGVYLTVPIFNRNGDTLNVDFDENGTVLGLEFIGAAGLLGDVWRREFQCTGNCIFDGDVLGPEDLACPVHGVFAQEEAQRLGWKRLSWMKAARESYPYAPAGPPVDYFPEGVPE